jgi:SOS-response transcriptional repressor LexA
MKREVLTEKEKQLLDVMRKHRRLQYPSVRELAKLMSVRSPATIHHQLVALRAKGWIQ